MKVKESDLSIYLLRTEKLGCQQPEIRKKEGWLVKISSLSPCPQGEQGGMEFIFLPSNSEELQVLQGMCLCGHVCVNSADSCYVLS